MKELSIKTFCFIFILLSIPVTAQQVGVLKYGGGGDWYANPTAVPNLLRYCNASINTKLIEKPETVEVGSSEIFNFPIVFMTGHGNIFFDDNEAENLRNYLSAGGFLHISDNYGMDKYIRIELKKVFPNLELQEIPYNHPIYNQSYQFKSLPKIHEHDGKAPQGFGLFFKGRLICFYDFESDLSDGWEDQAVHNNPEALREKALKMGANIIEYVFKTSTNEVLDNLKINFDDGGLWVLNGTLAIIMFGVALGISIADFKRLFKNPKIVLAGICAQFILFPLLTYIIVNIINPYPSIALGMIMVAACPGGNISNFMSQLAGGIAALSVSLTAFATLVAVVMTPINLQFWGNLYEPSAQILRTIELDPYTLVKLVTLILGIPLVLGMLTKIYFADLASKLSKVLKPTSMIIFLIFIIVAFSQNLDIFMEYIHYVLAIVVFHNVIGYLGGFYFAKLLKLSFKDQKTLAIETGIQNSGLGLLLYFNFFEESGLGGMALCIAFWGIWDIASGLGLAYYWSKKTSKIKA